MADEDPHALEIGHSPKLESVRNERRDLSVVGADKPLSRALSAGRLRYRRRSTRTQEAVTRSLTFQMRSADNPSPAGARS